MMRIDYLVGAKNKNIYTIRPKDILKDIKYENRRCVKTQEFLGPRAKTYGDKK